MPDSIRLHDLARVAQADPRTLGRWSAAGTLSATNRGRGPGNGITFSRAQALEALAVLTLRRAGVPLQRLRPLVRELRRRGWTGADFLQVGAHGRVALVDGDGGGVPLRDPRTGQYHLALVIDLRALRAQAEQLVDQLAHEPTAGREADAILTS